MDMGMDRWMMLYFNTITPLFNWNFEKTGFYRKRLQICRGLPPH